jgi:predicted RNA binding protein YcfA (HicA-like mRNA interferase family)
MPRGWPPLTLRDLIAILGALGFHHSKSSGGHDFYVGMHGGRKCKVTVDQKCAPFSPDLLRSMCKQAGCTREEFYGATPGTAAKVRIKPKAQPEEV